jgi:isopentenyl diphosphate isomerase/L-lactate dehydrogenase-like FMN-dependent dehydrogenase
MPGARSHGRCTGRLPKPSRQTQQFFISSILANLGSGVPTSPQELQSYVGAQHDPAIGFDDIGWLREKVNFPVVVNGVLCGDDAAACVDAGADAVAVSNHGDRQLDMSVATADALAEVTDRVGGRAEVYVDGGIRCGTDVL